MTSTPSAHPPRAAVHSTYRMQLHADFTFADAAAQVPYLAQLGVSHLYLSPILTAVPGSRHGYDVLDHRHVNPELGGRTGFEKLGSVAAEHGLAIIVDVVPNHMALVAPQWTNAPFWQVLREGRTARTAHWFDIDWAAGPVGLPVLGSKLEEVIAARELRLDTGGADEGPAAGQPVLRYYDHVFPITPASLAPLANAHHGGGDLSAQQWTDLLAEQHYRLGHWREDADILNYRRFFEVDTLIGIRVEQSDVFEATHAELLDLHRHGLIDGFRIDHPDGLADPETYLQDLSRACRPGTGIWIEKILHGAERLPVEWDQFSAGTTGYDAAAALLEAFSPGSPARADTLDQEWSRAGGEPSFAVVEHAAKAEAVDTLLGPEMDRLVRRASQALPHLDAADLRSALRALLVATAAYRIYLIPGQTADPAQVQQLDALIERAVTADPDHEAAIRSVGRVLASPESSVHDPIAARDLAIRFQQTSGPVMAKGIEDTAFYRWHRVVARNEVGADPVAPTGARGLTALHAWAENQAAHWPSGMTTLSTHDTKRSEDVRARLLALSWYPELWHELSERAHEAARAAQVDGPTAHLIWQTVAAVPDLSADRLDDYLTKALREGKQHTTWIDVDEAYESRALEFGRTILAGEIGARITAAMDQIAAQIRVLTLAQKAVQLTLPGVPDTYQGNEALDYSLVDPDNRRPVDYPARQVSLDQVRTAGDGGAGSGDPGRLPSDLGQAKLAVTAAILQARRDHPTAFAGGYRSWEVDPERSGADEPAAVAFERIGSRVTEPEVHAGAEPAQDTPTDRVVVLAARTVAAQPGAPIAGLDLASLTDSNPADRWTDIITGRSYHGEDRVEVDDHTPVAVLIAHDRPRGSQPAAAEGTAG